MQGSSPARPKIEESYPLIGSDITAVSRLDERVDEAGFRTSGQATYGSGWGNAPVSTETPSFPVPTLPYSPAGMSITSLAAGDEKGDNDPQGVSYGNHVQFATYPQNNLGTPQQLGAPPSPLDPQSKTWLPLPLRPYFWIPLIMILVGAAIGLEIALHLSNKHRGWASGGTDRKSMALHYAYTLPPVVVASFFVAMWAWTDVEIKKIQPYVDLVHGDSPPHRSLLLDYTRYNNFLVWTRAASNRHYLVALASLMVILTLSFQPLASALLVVKDIWWQEPEITTKNLGVIGLNQNLQFNDLTSFVTGAGYAGALILYGLPPPPFIAVPYTLAPFELPTTTTNGTAFVNTTAVKTSTGCQTIPVQMTQLGGGSWTNSMSSYGCSFTWNVSKTTDILFGVDIPTCDANQPPQFSPVVFWFFKYTPSPIASATLCQPSFSIWEVNAGVDVKTGNVTKVSEIQPFSQTSNFSSFSANVTGPPLNGRAYNGIRFNLTNPDQFVLGRQNATQLQLPAAIYQAATRSPVGYVGNFANSGFKALSDEVYGMYLALVAQQVYFLPVSEPLSVEVRMFRNRVFVDNVAAHLLTTALLILAFFATIVHLLHREDRRDLKLKHEPGTIASAVSIGAKTGVGNVLSGRLSENDIKDALRNKKFRIDPVTMKIIMEGESGYETAAIPTSPMLRRKSFLDILSGSGANRRFSRSTFGVAVTPTTPSFPQPQTPKSSDQKHEGFLSAPSPSSPNFQQNV